MKKTSALIISISVFLTFAFAISCNKKFDEPPPYTPPNITPTLTIAQLKAMHATGSTETLLTDDIIQGTVIANDSSGNFYKQIIIQDSTGGIAVNIDDYNLYTAYPEGRNVFIKLKGLILYDASKQIEIGGSKDVNNNINPIASALKNNYVIKSTLNNSVTPKMVDISDLNDSYQNTLIQIENMEFADADTSKLFADTSSSKSAVSFLLKNCSNKTITLRTSGYSYFAGVAVPNGNGTITAVYTVYNSARQLVIRDTDDVQFKGNRCDGSGINGTAVLTTITNIRSLYKGSDLKLGAFKIGGVVISDAANKNISTGSVVLQDGNAGISVYFGGTITYNIGDSIVLDVTGDSLQNYAGSLEIKTAYGTVKPAPVATGISIVPQQVTIAQLTANLSNTEYTLVKITDATAKGNATYSGSNTLTDASGSITLYTSSFATFANDNLPAGASDWVGFAKFFSSTKEFTIRNTSDVTPTGGGTSGDGIELTTAPFTLNFDNLISGLPAGVLVKLSSTSTAAGTDAAFSGSPVSWGNTASGFKNFASATGLSASVDAAAQAASANRALGVRQTGTAGYDPGAAFVFKISNTAGKSNLSFSFLLQSLDNSIGRTTIWKVDYAVGNTPASFTTIATSPADIFTGPTFASTPVTVNFGNALNNKNSNVWIRIVTLTATTGSGSRASTGIDDVKINWQ